MDDHRLRTSSMKNAILLALAPSALATTTLISDNTQFTSVDQIVGAKGQAFVDPVALAKEAGTVSSGGMATWVLPALTGTESTFALSDVNARKYVKTLETILDPADIADVVDSIMYQYRVTKVNGNTISAPVYKNGALDGGCMNLDIGCVHEGITMPVETSTPSLYNKAYETARTISCTLPTLTNAQINDGYAPSVLYATATTPAVLQDQDFEANSESTCGWTFTMELAYTVELQFYSGSHELGPSFSMDVTGGHKFSFGGYTDLSTAVTDGVTTISYSGNPGKDIPFAINTVATISDNTDTNTVGGGGGTITFQKSSAIECAGTLGFASATERCSYDAPCALKFEAACAANDYTYHTSSLATDEFTISFDFTDAQDISDCSGALTPSGAETDEACGAKLVQWYSATSCVDVADASTACLHMGDSAPTSLVATQSEISNAVALAKLSRGGAGNGIISKDATTNTDTMYFYVRFRGSETATTPKVSVRLPYKVVHNFVGTS